MGTLRAYSIRLHSAMIEKAGDGRIVVAFDVIAVESDTRGVALTPMQFEATDELTRREQRATEGVQSSPPSVVRGDGSLTGRLINNRAKPKQRVGEAFPQRSVLCRLPPSLHRRLLHKHTGTS